MSNTYTGSITLVSVEDGVSGSTTVYSIQANPVSLYKAIDSANNLTFLNGQSLRLYAQRVGEDGNEVLTPGVDFDSNLSFASAGEVYNNIWVLLSGLEVEAPGYVEADVSQGFQPDTTYYILDSNNDYVVFDTTGQSPQPGVTYYIYGLITIQDALADFRQFLPANNPQYVEINLSKLLSYTKPNGATSNNYEILASLQNTLYHNNVAIIYGVYIYKGVGDSEPPLAHDLLVQDAVIFQFGTSENMAKFAVQSDKILASINEAQMAFENTGLKIYGTGLEIYGQVSDTIPILSYDSTAQALRIVGSGEFTGTITATDGIFSGDVIAKSFNGNNGTISGWLMLEEGLFSNSGDNDFQYVYNEFTLYDPQNPPPEGINLYYQDEESTIYEEYDVNNPPASGTQLYTRTPTANIELLSGQSLIRAKKIELGTGATIKDYLCLGDPDADNLEYNAYLYNSNEHNGVVLATVHNDGGTTTQTIRLMQDGRLYLGTGDTQLVLDGNSSQIFGSTWALANHVARFENAEISGTLRTAVFERNKVQAVGGSMIFRPSAKVNSIEGPTEHDEYIVAADDQFDPEITYYEKVDNEYVVTLDETPDPNKTYYIYTTLYRYTVTISDTLDLSPTTNSEIYYIALVGEDVVGNEYEGANYKLVSIDTSDNTQYIQTATDETQLIFDVDNPCNIQTVINIGQDGQTILAANTGSQLGSFAAARGFGITSFVAPTDAEPNPSITIKALLGDISSIAEVAQAGGKWGLYCDDVYLKGQLTTKIPTDNEPAYAGIATNSDVEKNGEQIIFWGGARDANDDAIQNAPFIVTADGSLYASKGTFEGSIITKSTIEGSIIKTAKIIGNGLEEDPSNPGHTRNDGYGLGIFNTNDGIVFGTIDNPGEETEQVSINYILGQDQFCIRRFTTGENATIIAEDIPFITILGNNVNFIGNEAIFNSIKTTANPNYYLNIENNKIIGSCDGEQSLPKIEFSDELNFGFKSVSDINIDETRVEINSTVTYIANEFLLGNPSGNLEVKMDYQVARNNSNDIIGYNLYIMPVGSVEGG